MIKIDDKENNIFNQISFKGSVFTELNISDIFKATILNKLNKIASKFKNVPLYNYDTTCIYCNSLENCVEKDTLNVKNLIFVSKHGFLSITHKPVISVKDKNMKLNQHVFTLHNHVLPTSDVDFTIFVY